MSMLPVLQRLGDACGYWLSNSVRLVVAAEVEIHYFILQVTGSSQERKNIIKYDGYESHNLHMK